MTAEELFRDFQNVKIQIHVSNAEEWDACLEMLEERGFTHRFTAREWRGRANYFVKGGSNSTHFGLNYNPEHGFGKVVEYGEIAFINAEEPVFEPATARDVLVLLGM